jgi:hypothetical protein
MATASDRPGYTHLGNSLGAMFFGGPARDARYEDIYNKSAKDQVSLEDLVMKARKERDAQIGRDGAVQRALDSGHPEIADWIRNSPNAASSLEAQLHGQALDFGQKAWDTATGPNANTDASLEQLARMEAVRGHNMDLTKIEGGLEFTPQRTPADQSSQLETPGGIASRKHSEALTGEADARTKYIQGPQTQAERALTGQRMRGPRGTAGSGALGAAEEKNIFSDGAGGTDHAKLNDFKIWMYDNGLTDEHGAVGLYLKTHPDAAPEAPAAPEDKSSSLLDLFGISPDTIKTLGGGLRKDVAGAFAGGGGGDGTPVTPKSQAEFDQMPSGTVFINPKDGKPYRKK